MASLNTYMKTYEEKKACLAREISDQEEIEMINTIAFRSPETRDAFDLATRIECLTGRAASGGRYGLFFTLNS